MCFGLVASVAIPLVGVAVLGIWNAVSEERSHSSGALRLQAQTFAVLFDQHITDLDSLLSGVAASANLWEGDLSRLSAVMRAVDIPAGDVLAVMSDDGGVLFNTLPVVPGRALSPSRNRDMLQFLGSHTSGVTNLFRGPQTNSFRVAVVRPVSLSSMPAGAAHALVYSMRASRLGEELFAGVFPAGLAIEVIDRNGTVIAGSQRAENLIGQPVDPVLLAETAKADSGLFRAPDAAARPGSVAFAHSRLSGFTVMVRASDTAFIASLRGYVGEMLLATALFCLPGIVLILATTRRLTAGLSLLSEIASGNVFGLRSSAVREIDAAATTLIRAKSAEAIARERLNMLNASLESRVEQAVADLELARERTMHARRLETLGSLASGVAHDFGNVLQVVDGCASLILENLNEGQAVERWASMLEAEVKRGMAVVERLMSYSRKEALQASEANVALLLGGVAEILRHTLPKTVAVVVDAPPDLPPIWADKAQLETLLINLGTNARDAMVDGGTFTMSATVIEPTGTSPEPAFIRIDATDTGTGMPADVLARATEPFFTTKAVGKGTGLGLAMARDLAEKSGGRMTITSKVGVGTTVSLFIPASSREAAPPAALGASPVAAAPMTEKAPRILLIEDLTELGDVIARNLRRREFTVVVEAEAEPALARIEAGEPLDIVITDYWLGAIQGDDVIAKTHRLRPGLPIIVLTGNTQEAEAFIGAYEYARYVRLMRKPSTGRDLAEAVQNLLHECSVSGPLPREKFAL